ncbi:MAG: 8-amino-7-oxononanoate synthase [Deltaproteobacteria bacterium]|nr:8-amino-7-oxononanoate synthase [Deltaproteobacteria bacterium]
MALDDDVRAELAGLEGTHRLRTQRVVDGPQGPTVVLDGVEVVNLSSNDYLSLAGDRRLAKAAAAALDEAGSGAGASRLIAGTQRAHVVLERAVEDWLRCGGVRLFNTGYAANVGVLTTLVHAGDVVFSDELNHASIIDGCRLARAEVVVVPHRDLVALEQALADVRGPRRKLVVTESLFSMDGDIADLHAVAALCRRFEAAFVVDEAHAIGAHGPEGRGLCAEAAVEPDVVIGTFGKALGSFGAFAATTRPIAELLWNRARTFVFSTALPPSIPASSLAAIEIVRGTEGLERRRLLASHARRFRERVTQAGGARDSAIAPIHVGDDREVMRLTAELLEARMFVQGIRPPTVPEGTARLRVSLAAGHSVQQVETAGLSIVNAMRHDA